jgi:hypothetical protein
MPPYQNKVERKATDYYPYRFINCEKWRKDFGTDDLAKNFEYTEREKMYQYYPQYYHKTDKVGTFYCINMGVGADN